MQRSKRYKDSAKELDLEKKYSLDEALLIIKKTSTVKFDASVEAHVKLGINPKQSDQVMRTAVTLPHGTGKKLKIAAFVTSTKEKEAKEAGAELVGGKELVTQIKGSGKLNFDIAVAEPAIMRELAIIAKILGQKGKMPSPKTGTVSPNVAKVIKEIAGGKIDVKTDDQGNVHQIIGKVSYDSAKLKKNFETLLDAIKQAKPAGAKSEYIKGISISSSMGPGIKVSL
ncbi:MAG: 50S ribosomal protein L1 [Candidatus Doudnabacteria bacterium CG10_big_fil_rev_8_21_14_0_10_41_10]|uniref:Large ribosomal subunit protein uL1 n=1 Tax=Candidatus Doudnabacteria bacterium CG10_big_fil_rev_8_21_14_0_10_41_10 TaxID=1974551 RepID=A0A2H0VC73_9BACT|nr:MAG: 50S ribosomal protein L1 [Candidatus Doudnabacteria bacterium CG10_big_fil_rev_8_21_14_0_10_41_10]